MDQARIGRYGFSKGKKGGGRYVLYWMQQSQRTRYNHALEHAIGLSNDEKLPLLVFFGVTDSYPEANERHYHFMMEGLKDVKLRLEERNIGFICLKESPEKGIECLLKDAKHLVMDVGYMKIQRFWRKTVLEKAKDQAIESWTVESDVLVPVQEASDKEEIAARTIRKKIQRKLPLYMKSLEEKAVERKWGEGDFSHVKKLVDGSQILDVEDVEGTMKKLDLDRSVKRSQVYRGGEINAQKELEGFLKYKLKRYDERNHPEYDYCSNMSTYLHFGQISALEAALRAKEAFEKDNEIGDEAYESFMEELIVRRELAINFVCYNEDYDSFSRMTHDWALKTMDAHRMDERDYEYSIEQLENCKTHDPYFNAAMKEMVVTGKMHTYMRMYWCKKILEWVSPYEKAYETAIYLNNRYFIDGRDANSYTGVAWCFGKHDRAWKEREVFGKIRYMNSNGLKRKFDMDGYIKRVESLCGGTTQQQLSMIGE